MAVRGCGDGEKAVMLRYGELFLKSEPVKRQFVNTLLRNTAKALDAGGVAHRFEVHRGRILIRGDDTEEAARVASRIFGIVDVAVCTITPPDPACLEAEAVVLAARALSPGMTFAVRPRRQGVNGISSQELGARAGAAVLGEVPSARVDLEKPDYEIFIELREFGGLVYDSRIPGPGGLPWGTQGRILALLSSGIDSPVAAWLLMKRGCEVETLYIHSGRYAGGDVYEKALCNHAVLSTWCAGYPMKMHVADAEFFYDILMRQHEQRLRCVLCKRFMTGLAGALSKRLGTLAVCTGDSLGQVASQTLSNLSVVSEATRVPLLRPLLAFDKNDTISIARRIGSFSAKPGDLSCAAVPRMPATTSGLEEVRDAEERMDMESLVREAMDRVRVITMCNGKLCGE